MKHKLSNFQKRLDEHNSKVSSNLNANQTVEVTARENAKNAISSEEVIIQEIRKSKARIVQSLHNLECRPSEIVHTEIVAQTLRESQTKWRVAPKRKTGAAANHLLKQAADCTLLQSQIDWTIEQSNHWTKNLKSLKNMVCCRLMPGSNLLKREKPFNAVLKPPKNENKELTKRIIVSIVSSCFVFSVFGLQYTSFVFFLSRA